MRKMALAAAALAAITLPAPASTQAFADGAFMGHGSRQPRFVAPPSIGDCRGRDGHHGRRGGGCGGFGGFGGGYVYDDGGWAIANNRSWDSDSYNDWWHDRPDRAFPRWMSHNQDCARMWYSGDTLSC